MRILILGDANREHEACNKILGKILKEHDLPKGLHATMRNGTQIIGDTLYKVFSINLALDFEPVKELMTSGLSDHGGLKIKLTGVPDKAWFKRIKIPNKKIGQ